MCGPLQARTSIFKEADLLISRGGLTLVPSCRPPLRYKSNVPLIPASILKIATADATLSLLEPGFRFRTEFYQDTKGRLIIKGFGDPFLISEEITLISRKLRKHLRQPPSRIMIDQSAFKLNRRTAGTGNSLNPYDAGNAALAVNFDTVKIKVAADLSTASAEPQTPTLPIMQALGQKTGPGEYRITIPDLKNSTVHYAGQLFAALLQKTDNQDPIQVGIFQGELPSKPVYTHYSSKKLTEVVKAMLLYSNNFIANQLFLVCGAQRYGYPATWNKGRQALAGFLNCEVGLPAQSFLIREGSGLSRANLITAEAMIRVLKHFRPYAHLLPDCQGHLLKSGTMSGVYSFAGYLKGDKGLQPLVIILNQRENNRDQLLKLLQEKPLTP
ncbi:MAG: D-alanyl-D-alanine carboxypeptidase [Desulfobia sp.]